MLAPPAHLRRSSVFVAFLIVLFLFSSFRLVVGTPKPAHNVLDDIAARSDDRFAPLKAHLSTEGVIGYIGESGQSSLPDYYLAQYALAPVVVDHATNHAIVIGNFPHSAPSEIPPDLKLVQNFGNGVLLFAGRDTK